MSGLDPKTPGLPGLRMLAAGLQLTFIVVLELDRVNTIYGSSNNHQSHRYRIVVHGESYNDCKEQVAQCMNDIAQDILSKGNYIVNHAGFALEEF